MFSVQKNERLIGLVDFAIGLLNSVLNLPDGASEDFWGIQIT